jgi:hypothetical protein
MENEIITKRGLILILVIATVAILVGLVWLIATYVPWNRLGFSSPSITPTTSRIEKNCTYPVSYWMEHPELYPPQMVLGSKVYQANDIHEALTGSDEDPTAQLQAQLVGAFLNISSGADQGLIETTIFQAYSWLVQHPDGSQVSESELETGSRYYNILEAYNLGLAGVAPCEEETTIIKTYTATPSGVPPTVATVTPSQTLTITPSETATPIEITATATYMVILPTNTAIQNTEPPIQLPTNTPREPTVQPSSTPTEQPPPPDTPTNTSQPPDTSTPETPATITPPATEPATATLPPP